MKPLSLKGPFGTGQQWVQNVDVRAVRTQKTVDLVVEWDFRRATFVSKLIYG